MGLKSIADQWLQRQKTESCTVASPRECNRATFGGEDATMHATSVQQGRLKTLCRAKSIATYHATRVQLGEKNHATFDATLGAKSCIELHDYPAVWRVILAGSGKDYTMTVIDPDRMPDDKFLQYLSEKFGADRVLSTSRKAWR